MQTDKNKNNKSTEKNTANLAKSSTKKSSTSSKKTYPNITLDNIKNHARFKVLIESANNNLKVMGYTEHGLRHVGYVSKTTSNILRELGYDKRIIELGAIAGWIHDIGNAVNRKNHGLTGATMAFTLLTKMHMAPEEISMIIGAIGNHEEETGLPINEVSAALIIADKSDAHRSRVRRESFDINDIHDRVNISIKKNFITVDTKKKVIRLIIYMDDRSATMEYLQIYLSRIAMSEKAANYLDCNFELVINDVVINRKMPLRVTDEVKLSEGEKEVSEEGIN